MTVSDRPLPIVNDASSGSPKEHLEAALQRLRPREARIVTAYLTPDGFLSLKDSLSTVERVRVLAGGAAVQYGVMGETATMEGGLHVGRRARVARDALRRPP